MAKYERLKGETPKDYRIRLYQNQEAYGLSNAEVGKLCNEAMGVSYDESAHRKYVKPYLDGYNDAMDERVSGTEISQKLDEQRREITKERMKLQTEKTEYNRWLREEARDELFEEKILEAIRTKIGEMPTPKRIATSVGKKEAVLCIADMHFGKDFKVYGVNGEIANEYSPEIFYERMNCLLNETIEYVEKENITHIRVFNLGDSLDGFLRHSQVWTLRYGVVDSAIYFAEYLGRWLNTLSQHTNVFYEQTSGNHGELRLLDGTKGAHTNDNIEKIVGYIIKLINEGNPNFAMLDNRSGFIFDTVAGFNLLGIHGEAKNEELAMKEYTNIYGEQIDYLIGGHKHTNSSKSTGNRKGYIGVGSVMGADDYAYKLRKCNDATATMLIFEEGKGKVDEHTFVLN